jgi:CRP-like cAMP-binding protein
VTNPLYKQGIFVQIRWTHCKVEGGDDYIRMPAFTHEVLAQCVGTTREMITRCMIQFRRKGFIKYSRREVILYGSLREWTSQQ